MSGIKFNLIVLIVLCCFSQQSFALYMNYFNVLANAYDSDYPYYPSFWLPVTSVHDAFKFDNSTAEEVNNFRYHLPVVPSSNNACLLMRNAKYPNNYWAVESIPTFAHFYHISHVYVCKTKGDTIRLCNQLLDIFVRHYSFSWYMTLGYGGQQASPANTGTLNASCPSDLPHTDRYMHFTMSQGSAAVAGDWATYRVYPGVSINWFSDSWELSPLYNYAHMFQNNCLVKCKSDLSLAKAEILRETPYYWNSLSGWAALPCWPFFCLSNYTSNFVYVSNLLPVIASLTSFGIITRRKKPFRVTQRR